MAERQPRNYFETSGATVAWGVAPPPRFLCPDPMPLSRNPPDHGQGESPTTELQTG